MTSFFGAKPRASKAAPPETSLRVTTSVQGTPIPIGWGTNRIAPNLIYYNDFKSIQIQQNTGGGGGGKGLFGSPAQGGGSTQTQYSATIIAGLCEGPIISVGNIWSGKNISSAGGLNFSLFNGSYTQTAWGYITSAHPADARAYRGVAYLAAAPFNLDTSPNLPSLNVETLFGFFAPQGAPSDANPRDVIVDVLTNNKYGGLFPSGRLGDSDVYQIANIYLVADVYNLGFFTSLNSYCQAVGIFMSPVLVSNTALNSFLSDILYGCVAEAVWSGGALKIVPYYDATITGNGYTYTPNISPLFDLTDNDFIIGTGGSYSSPVISKTKAVSDIYNTVTIEYLDRTNNYNPTVMEAKDDASIQAYTLRKRDLKQLHHFCLAGSTLTCAHLQLGREQVLTTYEFSLGPKYVLLEPMDLVTLTDVYLGLARKLVRIKEITENEDYTLTFIAEDMLIGAASPPVYGSQANAGFTTNTNVDPGLVLQPFFFEPTDQLVGQLEVMMAVEPVNLNTWGGANVYVSYDGTNYVFAGQQLGPTTMGVLTATLPSTSVSTTPPTIDNISTLSVDLTASAGQLLTATQADLLGFATLCYVGGEFLAYRDATVTGANKYNLTTLNRGGYGTVPTSSAAGATFVRINNGVFRIPFTQDRIGQTLFIKLVNFNKYGAGPQTLASVSPYAYTIQGIALTSPLPNVQNFTTNYQSNITLFAWDEIKDFRNPIDYEIRRGVDWNTGLVIGRYLHPNVPAIGSTVGSNQYLIKAHCQPAPGLDVYSSDASSLVIVTNAAVIPLNVVKSFDEFSGATGILTGTFGGNAYNNTNTIETFASGDVYAIPDVYALPDWYAFFYGSIPSNVYTIPDIYAIPDIYFISLNMVVSGTYTIPNSHIVDVGRSVGCLVDCSWTSSGVLVGQNIFTITDIFSLTDIFGSTVNKFATAFPNINLSSDGTFAGDIYSITDIYAAVVSDIYNFYSPTSTGWQRYRAGFYVARGFALQMFLQSVDPQTIAAVSSFAYAVHIPSRIDHFIGVSVPGTVGGLTVTFQPDDAGSPAAFNGGPGGSQSSPGLPTWQASILNEASGDLLTVTSLTLSGAVVKVTNGGSPVARTINIEFAGY